MSLTEDDFEERQEPESELLDGSSEYGEELDNGYGLPYGDDFDDSISDSFDSEEF